MSYILNYTSIFRTKIRAKSRFGGSSKYRVVNDELITIKKEARELLNIENKVINSKKNKTDIEVSELGTFDIENQEFKQPAPENKEIHSYRINKSKVKRKCHALSRLEKSKNFMAFYSISFPQGLTDQIAYKVFNTWLTRCRKSAKLKTYLWVAERQKNGTIHFHLLTNDHMAIKEVNGYMATALTTEKNKGNEVLKVVNTNVYNGVDVKKVKKNKKGLITYIAKYVSKNNIEFYRLPWHCSRDVSRLFTSTTFEGEEGKHYLDMLPKDRDAYTERITDHNMYEGYGFKFTASESLFENIDSVNEVIYGTK